jgi:hypothetical protein
MEKNIGGEDMCNTIAHVSSNSQSKRKIRKAKIERATGRKIFSLPRSQPDL